MSPSCFPPPPAPPLGAAWAWSSCVAASSSVLGRFDVIAFNAPYIPVEKGWSLGAWRAEVDERRWSGGVTGMVTIERFLDQAPAHLERAGIILLGVNHFYLTQRSVLAAVSNASLQLAAVQRGLARSSVYVLGHAAHSAHTRSTPPETRTTSPTRGA